MKAAAAVLFLLAIVGSAPGQQTNAQRLANLAQVEQWSADAAAEAAGNTNRLIRRGLRADRNRREVELLAEATGLSGGATAEFFLIGEHSEKDYEALMVAFAAPGDLGKALEFIGLPPGLNVVPSAFRFWPRGERVRVAVGPVATNSPVRPLEDYVLDRRRGQPLPPRGFVYCGSVWTNLEGRAACRADFEQPMSILSTYNEPYTVLDVPRQALQSDVYETFVANPQAAIPARTLLRLTFSPEPRTNALPRVMPVDLRAEPAASQADGLTFACSVDGRPVPAMNGLQPLLALLMASVKADRDPYVAIAFDDRLTLERARAVSQALQMVEGENGIRMEPPPPGQIYYRGFMPNESWRNRKERLAQPWELRVAAAADAGRWRLTLVQTLEDWSDPKSLSPALTVREHPLATAVEAPAVMAAADRGLPVLLVYAPAGAPLSAFMPAVRLLQKTHPTVYVFIEP